VKLVLVERRACAAALPVPPQTLAGLVGPLGRPDWELNLVLVQNREMAALNAAWYGGEGPTDVLSFSYLEEQGVGPPVLAAGTGGAACDLWVSPAEMPAVLTPGEVVLAPAYVAARTAAGGWDPAAEWALLLVHGALHVLGWRHGSIAERRAMQAREAELLRQGGFDHPLLTGPRED
jgi:probable rRNA maturation factor